MKCVFLIALLMLSFRARAAEKLVDISGIYVENGMPIRTSAGAPKLNVSLCSLLTGILDPSEHALLARPDRRIKVTQEGELVLEIYISGGLPGQCIYTTTNVDGLKVDATALTFSMGIREKPGGPTDRVRHYRFELDPQGALIVDIDFIVSRSGSLGRTTNTRETGRYAFPRFVGADAPGGKK